MNRISSLKIAILIIAVSLASASKLQSQVNGFAAILSTKGFVFFDNGESIDGFIAWKQKYIENNPYEIKFTGKDGEIKIYSASTIAGFTTYSSSENDENGKPVYYGQETYYSRPSLKKGIPVFMYRLLDGKIKVYMNRSSTSTSTSKVEETSKFDGIGFSLSRGEGLRIGPTYTTTYTVIEGRTRYSSYFVEKYKGQLVKVTKKNYDELFPKIFDMCPAIQKELEKNPDLKLFKNFMIFTEVYNQLCNNY